MPNKKVYENIICKSQPFFFFWKRNYWNANKSDVNHKLPEAPLFLEMMKCENKSARKGNTERVLKNDVESFNKLSQFSLFKPSGIADNCFFAAVRFIFSENRKNYSRIIKDRATVSGLVGN